jgi:hypothetical protein
MIVLAPFLAIGFIKIGETAGVTMRKVASKLGFGNLGLVSLSRVTRLLSIYLVLFFLLSSGFVFAFTEGYQNIALNNGIQGQHTHQDVVGATWVVDNGGTIPIPGKFVTIYHSINNVRYNDANIGPTNSNGQITLNQTFTSTGPYYYYATYAGDPSYGATTSAVVNVNVGGSQASSQATTNIASGHVQTITLSASNTTPAIGQPVTFTATFTGIQRVYGDFYGRELLTSVAPADQAKNLLPPQNTSGFYTFLDTYNIEHNQAQVFNYIGVNYEMYDINTTALTSDKNLIYSNGGTNVYS